MTDVDFDVRELAADYAALVAAGKMDEAAMKYWADDIVTREAMPGEMAETRGKAETLRKAEWWYANHEVHGLRSEGPFVNGDSFLLILEIDVTPKGGERMQMREVVSYRIAGDKVVEERYFY
jgi:ketosteroid isomerase-like protein